MMKKLAIGSRQASECAAMILDLMAYSKGNASVMIIVSISFGRFTVVQFIRLMPKHITFHRLQFFERVS